MKPERMFQVVATIGLFVALLLVLAALTHSSTYASVTQYAFPSRDIAMDASAFLHVGIAGGLYAGWSLTILMLARHERLAKEPALWNAIACGLVLWYVTDSLASVATGGSYNLIGNTLFFVLMLWPALRMKRKFSVR